ncbi:hypothetical protein V6O07_16200, partial [Arthrospira platensis SPKY2]
MKLEAKFSTFTINSILENLELSMQYGKCSIEEINPKFREVSIVNSFGNVDMRFAPPIGFNLEGESNFGNIKFPKSFDIRVEETSFTRKSYKGT